MICDQDIIKGYIDKKFTPKTISDLHQELLLRQGMHNVRRSILPNVSSITVLDDGYIERLGVSAPHDLVTDNLGKLIASIFSNTAGTGSSVNLTSIVGVNQYNCQAGNWNNNCTTPTSGRSGFFGDGTTAQGNTTYLQLGTGLTEVLRSDITVETPCTGALAGNLPAPSGAGYGSGEIAFQVVSPAATIANDVAESAICKSGLDDHHNNNIYCVLRYNYTPVTIAIGKQAVVDTTLYV
jgi:hypothetical protein